MVLLDGCGRQAGDTDAVAAHFQELRFAVFTQKGGIHGLAVFGAKVEHMADFDAALNGQYALAVRRGIAGNHIANVGNQIRLRQVAAPIHAGHVEIGFIGTADPVGQHRNFAVDHQLDRLFQVQRPQIARLAAKVFVNLGQAGKPEAGQASDLANLDFVHAVVAAQQQQPDLGLDGFACFIERVGGQNQ